jgi:hypothetical protein
MILLVAAGALEETFVSVIVMWLVVCLCAFFASVRQRVRVDIPQCAMFFSSGEAVEHEQTVLMFLMKSLQSPIAVFLDF